mmetsp:Transcript_31038/g.75009  ORF Transcript_31038/g.75009 Transcript_31038/m.75009 type:complete len:84 (-) Transcript_31038:1097-1348(-)
MFSVAHTDDITTCGILNIWTHTNFHTLIILEIKGIHMFSTEKVTRELIFVSSSINSQSNSSALQGMGMNCVNEAGCLVKELCG